MSGGGSIQLNIQCSNCHCPAFRTGVQNNQQKGDFVNKLSLAVMTLLIPFCDLFVFGHLPNFEMKTLFLILSDLAFVNTNNLQGARE